MNSCFEKPRRGRPLNSVTTVPVKLIDLLGYVNPQAKVVVGKKWLESIGVETTKEIREEDLFD